MIRLATQDDAGAVITMLRHFTEMGLFPQTFNEDDARASYAKALTNPDWVVLISRNKDAMLVGFTSPWLLNYGYQTAQEMGWWVEPEARKSGTARDLVMAFEKWARDKGCNSIVMSCFDKSEGDRIASMYMRHGYRLLQCGFIKELK